MSRFILIVILLLSLLISCSNESYRDNEQENPLEGIWNNYDASGQLLNRKVYTADRYTYFTIINGSEVTNVNAQQYTVIDNQLVFDRYTQTFRIDIDTLWITNSAGNKITKYIRFNDILQ